MAKYTAYEVQGPRQIGNFRSPKSILSAPKQWRLRRAGMSQNHLQLVRQMPCVVCGIHRYIHCHHLRCGRAGKERGVSVKATDRWAVSLCGMHHGETHRVGSRREQQWFAENAGIADICGYAQGLWNVSGDLEAMLRVYEAHKA